MCAAALQPSSPLPIRGSCRWETQAVTGSIHRRTVKLSPPPGTAKFNTLVQTVHEGLTRHDSRVVRDAYLRFFSEERDAYLRFFSEEHETQIWSYSPRPSQRKVLQASIVSLAELGDAELLDQILEFLHNQCGIPPELRLHEDIVRIFQTKGRLRSAYTWLMEMRSKAGGVIPTVQTWNHFIKKCRVHNIPEELLQAPMDCIRASGCDPDGQTYLTILKALFSDEHHPPRPEQFQPVLMEMEQRHMLTSATLEMIIRETMQHKMYEVATELEAKKALLEGEEPLSREARMNEMLLQRLVSEGEKKATQLLKDLARIGFQPDKDTLAILSRGIRNMRSLSYWEDLIGVKADSKVWETVIENAADYRVMEELYEASLRRDIRPTPGMLEPVLRGLCTAKWTPPSASRIDRACQLLRQYVELTKSHPTEISQERDAHDPQSDLPLYSIILRALSSSSERLRLQRGSLAHLHVLFYKNGCNCRTNTRSRLLFSSSV